MKKLLGIALVFGLYVEASCQVPFFHQHYFSRKNDPVQVNAILQEKKGFMWFGTSKGLYRLDGKTQKQFTIKEGLANDIVTALAEDSHGRIWIGYKDGRLGFFDNGTIQLFEPPEGSATKEVSDILFDSKGNLWFSTLNDGLYYVVSGRLYRVDEAEGMPDLYIYDLAEDSNGNIWAGTDGGVAVCTLQGNKIKIDVLNYDDGLPDNIIRKIVPANNHTMLLATEDAGVLQYDLASRKNHTLLQQAWPYGTVGDFELKGNKIWIACPQKGLVVYDFVTKERVLYTADQSPNLYAIRVLEKDFEGNIWIGNKSAVSRTLGDALQFMERPEPGGNVNILAVTVDRENNIWFSNSDGLFKKKLNEPSQIIRPLAHTPFGKNTVISLYTDPQGYVWAGLYGEGVLRINPQTGKVRHLSSELRNGNVLSIAGHANTVWLGTLGGSTKITLSENEELEITNFSSSDGLASDFIYQVFLENDQRVWFATDGKGVAMMNRNGFHHYYQELPGAVVYGMAQDAHRRIWVNVQGNGLYIFDGSKFHPCDSTLVLRDKNIHTLVADKMGNIVVMHDVGMDIIDVKKNKVVYLGEEVGLRDKIANLNAAGKDANGNIYFGTSAGIIRYTSDEDYLNKTPKPHLENFSVFDMPLDLHKQPDLSYDENNITINYLGLWYKNPDGLLYSYKLDNYDRDWITTKNQSVTYSRLPAGRYSFKLKVSQTPDFSNAKEVSMAFVIHPPFWQTIPFYFFTVALLITAAFLTVKRRERKFRRQNEILEAKVMLRTRELQQQSDEIQAQNEEISAQSEEILRINENLEEMVQERTRDLEKKNKALEEYAFINAHKLRSPVATILGLINLLGKTKLDDEGAEINRRLQCTSDELDSVVTTITKAIERSERKIPKVKDE